MDVRVTQGREASRPARGMGLVRIACRYAPLALVTRTYDANFAVTDVTSPALNLHFGRDVMGNLVSLGAAAGATPATESYAYDPLYRLTSVNDASGTAIEAYTYNKTGDRLSKAAPGKATVRTAIRPGRIGSRA